MSAGEGGVGGRPSRRNRGLPPIQDPSANRDLPPLQGSSGVRRPARGGAAGGSERPLGVQGSEGDDGQSTRRRLERDDNGLLVRRGNRASSRAPSRPGSRAPSERSAGSHSRTPPSSEADGNKEDEEGGSRSGATTGSEAGGSSRLDQGGSSRGSEGRRTPSRGSGDGLPPINRDLSPQKTSRFYSQSQASRRLEDITRHSAELQPQMNASTYAFNEDSGQLTTAGGGTLQATQPDAMYVEQPNNRFKRIVLDQRKRGLLDRVFGRGGGGAEGDEGGAEGGGWVEQDDRGGQVAALQTMVDGFQSFAAYVSLLSQGLLGGLGFTNLIMTYFANPNINLTSFLRYYSPMAMVLNRYYYVLVCFALVAAINKYARNTMWDWKPYGSRQRAFDAVLVALYGIAFIISVVITPFDDLLSYNSMRIPDYYDMHLTEEFKDKLDIWHALSLTRMVTVFTAWFLASLEFSPISTMIYWKFATQPRVGGVPVTMQRMPDGTTVPVLPVQQGVNPAGMMGSLDRRTMPGNAVLPDLG